MYIEKMKYNIQHRKGAIFCIGIPCDGCPLQIIGHNQYQCVLNKGTLSTYAEQEKLILLCNSDKDLELLIFELKLKGV